MSSQLPEELNLEELPAKWRRVLEAQRIRADKAEQNAAQERMRAGRSIMQYGFPPLRSDLVASECKSSSKYGRVQWKELPFGICTELTRTAGSSSLWRNVENGYSAWSTENDIQHLVIDALCDIRQEYGISEVRFRGDRGIASVRPDVIMLRMANQEIVGFVEVKRPIDGTMEDGHVFGQVFEYLCLLRSSGLDCCFGILTTYESWRVCWLQDCGSMASAIDESTWSEISSPFSLESGADVDDSSDLTQVKPVVHTSRVMKWNDDRLAPFLATCMKKMLCSRRRHVDRFRLTPKRLVLVLEEHRRRWSYLSSEHNVIVSHNCEVSESNLFILLEPLGGLTHGRVWMACDADDKTCALKLRSEDNMPSSCTKDESLAKECRIWNEIWQCGRVRVVSFGSWHGLVMPYVRVAKAPITSEEWSMILEAVDHFVSCGWHDPDCKPEHVGFVTSNSTGGERVVLLDPAQALTLADQNISSTTARERMLNALAPLCSNNQS